MKKNMKDKLVSGVVWKTLEEFAAKIVGLLVSVLLARLLMPEDYAVVAMIMVLLAITDVFINSGFPSALIQKKDADDVDFSSVFYINLAFSVLMYIVFFLAAPFVAEFYAMPILAPMMRVLSVKVLVTAVNSVQRAVVARKMIFKKFFFATIIGTVISAVVGIGLAYAGYGAWALIAQQLTNMVVDTAILWITVRWRPKLQFSWTKVKGLLSFGWKLTAAELFNEIYNNIRTIVIGKFYSAGDLAFYSKGREYPNSISSSLNASYNSVLFSALSKEQDDPEALRKIVKRGLKLSVYIVAPVMIGLAAVAEGAISIFLTEKWLPSVTYFQIFSMVYLLSSVQTINMQVPKAMGRSDITIKQEFLKKAIILVILIISAFISVYAIAVGSLLAQIIIFLINAYPPAKLIQYPIGVQIKDFLPELALAVVMGISVYGVGLLIPAAPVRLAVQVATGIFLYVGLSLVTRNESFYYALSIVRKPR